MVLCSPVGYLLGGSIIMVLGAALGHILRGSIGIFLEWALGNKFYTWEEYLNGFHFVHWVY